ncbi:MAG: AAA family ATPase [Roseburia faecis]
MGTYLNSITPYTLYKSECLSAYFVDKTLMLRELFPYVSAGNRHICITRPRRFGKTIMANMISSFFQKIPDSGDGKALLLYNEKRVEKEANLWMQK